MLCNSCSTLAFIQASKKCLKCQSNVDNNLSVICDKCSLQNKVCSVCLKKVQLNQYRHFGGCGTCKGK